MFLVAATKSLNDGTKGFRFNFFGVKGLVRMRKFKSRGFKIERGDCMVKIHAGKVTIYRELKANKATTRIIKHFAG